jgi:hypothetical protein
VTLRSEENRATRWRVLLQSVRDVLVTATEDQLADLREVAAATRSIAGLPPRDGRQRGDLR